MRKGVGHASQNDIEQQWTKSQQEAQEQEVNANGDEYYLYYYDSEDSEAGSGSESDPTVISDSIDQTSNQEFKESQQNELKIEIPQVQHFQSSFVLDEVKKLCNCTTQNETLTHILQVFYSSHSLFILSFILILIC